MKICTKPCCFLNTTKKSTFFRRNCYQSGRVLPGKDAEDRKTGGHLQQSELPAISGLLSDRARSCHDHFLFRRNSADAGDCPTVQTLRHAYSCVDQFWRKQPDCLRGLQADPVHKRKHLSESWGLRLPPVHDSLLDILYSEYFRQNYQKNYTHKLERARELEQHRTSTNPILLNLHKENAE